MKRVVFIGSAGTGKSTLATEVFTQLKKRKFNVELVSEFIRADIHQNGPMKSIWEQYRTLHHQRKLEDAVPDNVDWVITDSGTLTPYFYSCLYISTADERQRLCLSDMFKFLIDDLYQKRYAHVFFIPGEIIYKNKDILRDGTRYQTADELDILDNHMRLVFSRMFKVDNIHTLDCPLEERTQNALDIILRT